MWRVRALLRLLTLWSFVGGWGLVSSDVYAQDAEIPEPLKPWVPWVMHDQDALKCARHQDAVVCQWPGHLEVVAAQDQGTFTLKVWADANAKVLLPGGKLHWPQGVRVDGAQALVQVSDDGQPAVVVLPGAHEITGRWVWTSAPQVIQLPEHIGLIKLTALGKAIAEPRHDEQGRLWIRESGEGEQVSEADALRASIYRKIIDGVPLKVTTLLELNVSGRAREIELGSILLPQTRPVSIRGALPVQITSQGVVKVYARPGTHKIEIDAYLPSNTKTLKVPARQSEQFDAQEIWLWQPDEALRSVELKGLPTIDPGRTTLPEDWRGAVTMLASPGQPLTFETTRRGQDATNPNLLSLERTLWLDLNGNGYTVQDRISGKLNQQWRLNFGGAGVLGRVTKARDGDDLLITTLEDRQGVELRETTLNLVAESRVENARSSLMAVGWEHDMQSLSTMLHLPPGWSLMAASGVDKVDRTWVDSWSLFEFFVLLLIALAMGKLFGWPWGLVAILAMTLAHGYDDAPRYVWFHLLAGLALLRVLPERHLWPKRLLMVYIAGATIALVVILGPFAQRQIRYAIYPQIDSQHWSDTAKSSRVSMSSKFEAADVLNEEAPLSQSFDQKSNGIMVEGGAERGDFAGKKRKVSNKRGFIPQYSSTNISSNDWLDSSAIQQVDPNEVVQTGPGLPSWGWRSWRLEWSGPVTQDHKIKLWLLSPQLAALWRLLSVLFFVLMAMVLANPGRFALSSKGRRQGFELVGGLKRLLIPLSVLAFVGLSPLAARAADTPDAELLNELRSRLVQQQECEGPCLVISSMTLSADDRFVELRAEVHAQRLSAWTLPGPMSALTPERLELDGVETLRLRREAGGLLAVRIPAGRHELFMRARLGQSQVVTIQLDPNQLPHHVSFSGEQWLIDGLDEFGLPDSSLQLTRKSTPSKDAKPDGGEAAQSPESSRELPPWFFVQRVISLGMPWQTRTTISREDSERPQLIKIPLLAGESVITDGVRVEGGEALVQFARGVQVVEYVSELVQETQLKLNAPSDRPWTETWALECTRIWRCEYEGLTAVHLIGPQGVFEPMWKPWPGESISLKISKPKGAPGASSTLDHVEYSYTPGERLSSAELKLHIKASQGGWQRIKLPKGAQVQEVFVEGKSRNLQPRDGELALPLKPGAQVLTVRWQQPTGGGLWERMPVVDLGGPAANIELSIKMERQRWLLWASGPRWGPAILFWSHLVWMIFFALILGRLKHLPVRTYQWVLLALGMSQLPVVAILVMVSWFVMFSWREARQELPWYWFDLRQLILVGLTFAMIAALYGAVHVNLLVDVNMQVRGYNSTQTMLRWYTDRTTSVTPDASVLSVPLLVWRGLMLVWALWLVSSLLRWIPWGWRRFGMEGFWRPAPKPPLRPSYGPHASTQDAVPAVDSEALQTSAQVDGSVDDAEPVAPAPADEPPASPVKGEDP